MAKRFKINDYRFSADLLNGTAGNFVVFLEKRYENLTKAQRDKLVRKHFGNKVDVDIE